MNNQQTILQLCSYFIGNKLYRYLFDFVSASYDEIVYIPVKNQSLVGRNRINNPRIRLIYDPFLRPFHRFMYGLKIRSQKTRVENHLRIDLRTISQIDLIHAHTLFSDGGSAYLLSRKYGVPYIVSVRNTDINTFYKIAIHYRAFSHAVLRGASKIIFISHAYEKLLFSLLPKKVTLDIQDKCIVIPNGVSDIFFDAPISSRRVGGIRIITVASLDKNKNVLSVLKLVKRLVEEGLDVHYKIAGEGPLFNDLNDYVAQNGLIRNVTFLGRIGPVELIEHLDESNIFILVSFRETFGVAYIEAMARGLPIIYTKDQGVDGFFQNNEAGYSVNPDNIDEMRYALDRIFSCFDKHSEFCKSKAREFSWPMVSDKYMQIYDKTISQRFH